MCCNSIKNRRPAMRLPRSFDDTLMHAPDVGGAVDAALVAELRSWCEGGVELPVPRCSVADIAVNCQHNCDAFVMLTKRSIA